MSSAQRTDEEAKEESNKCLEVTHIDVPSVKSKRLQIHPLETAEQLFQWVPKSNTWKVIPLINKSDICYEPIIDSCHTFIIPKCFQRNTVPRTIFCHDLKGGYLEDRYIDGSEKHDEYRFFHWGGIDTFIYFSHQFVTIPPVGWINSAHQHGVKVLGTIITEWDKGIEIWNKLFEKEWYDVVDKLVLICISHKFDGYLINIENEFDKNKIPYLMNFLRGLRERLKKKIPHSEVIWYDSITKDGKLKWQNQLNEENILYFDICDGIFLNYNWTEEKLKESKILADNRYLDVYVGIDVFGRGCYGGGGFNTPSAFEVIRRHNLSAALFAPSWTYECHFKTGQFESLEYLFWKSIWPYLYIHGPSELPFTTSFCQGYGFHLSTKGKLKHSSTWFNLSLQEYQPNCVPCISLIDDNYNTWSENYIKGCTQHCYNEAYNGGGCLQLISPAGCLDNDSISKVFHTLFLASIPVPSDQLTSVTLIVKNEPVDKILELVMFLDSGAKEITQHIFTDGNLYNENDIEEENKVYKTCMHLPYMKKQKKSGWLIREYKFNPLTPEGAKIILIGCRHDKNLRKPICFGYLKIQGTN